ncbi:MAG: glycosyltransferase [Minisyncoccia bacterium]|jgi:glycosyltransferase involved in cell wall biosynthesis
MTKVLFVYTHTVLGGGETMLVRTISGLDKKRIASVAVISSKNERLYQELTRAGIRCVRLHDKNRPWKNKVFKAIVQIPNFLLLNVRMFFIIVKEKPDIVHAGLSYSALWSIVPARLLGKKFVWVGQTLSDFFAYPFLSKMLMRLSDVTVLTCADFNRLLKENGMAGVGRTEVIYTGLPQNVFESHSGGPILNIGEHHIKRPIVALIARFDESQKGFGYFWEMAGIIHGKMPAVNFVVAGAPVNAAEEEFKKRLDALAKKLGIWDNLFCVGFVNDLPVFFPCVDVVVIPSTYEAPSAVAMEAGAGGKPVVAFAVGGIPEVIRNGDTGWLVPHGDARGLAEKTMLLLREPEKAARMGERGREFVRKTFSQERLAENYSRLYESLVRGA